MKTVRNKTRLPLRVPLPQKKTLHLGPNREGQISVHAIDHEPLQRLVKDGKLEIVGEGDHAASPRAGDPNVHASTHGYHPDTPMARRGDRGK